MTRTVLIDNYDSFTHNVVHLLAEVDGCAPLVLRNDDLGAWRELTPADVGRIVISPGPGRPDVRRDFGISALALEWTDTPLLGICLGFQGLCLAEGARVVRGAGPVHGGVSPIRHDGRDLFAGLPSPFLATRYHSLVARDVPESLEVTATTEDGVVMAVRHRERPHWGVQFHPESIVSEHGRELIANFRALADRHTGTTAAPLVPARRGRRAPETGRYRVQVEPIGGPVDAETAFGRLFAAEPASFWLDSGVRTEQARFSVLGAPSGPLGELVSYDVADGHVRVSTVDGVERERFAGSLFAYLERELARRRVEPSGLPSGFELGYVGCLGYELKADTGGSAAHRSDLPDCSLVFCDRAVVLDHETGRTWLLALSDPAHPGTETAARRWLAHARTELASAVPEPFELPEPSEVDPVAALHRHGPDEYRALIDRCQDQIRAGESYEICLTTQISAMVQSEPWDLYRVLRRVNPAPFAAFLRFPGFAVLSSSPERFLRVDGTGEVEARPIKGTRPRGTDARSDTALVADLVSSEKDRAENLMIVDLLRNDLGSVAELGSVRVPELFAVESHASVHQLVSAVRARLRPEISAVECVRAAFPGGSMTGAPKKRTMEILDELEDGPRGLYSGALGYFSLTGTVDLSIVIRTIVVAGGEARLGVGGAIVAQSDPDAEIEETRVKAAALLRALSIAEHRATRPSRV
ncbi:aminodeoxychorismate synthase component I [Lentzea sp. NPDC055074]